MLGTDPGPLFPAFVARVRCGTDVILASQTDLLIHQIWWHVCFVLSIAYAPEIRHWESQQGLYL